MKVTHSLVYGGKTGHCKANIPLALLYKYLDWGQHTNYVLCPLVTRSVDIVTEMLLMVDLSYLNDCSCLVGKTSNSHVTATSLHNRCIL